MKVKKHTASGRWWVRIPARLSDSGKRESKYFDTKEKASQFIADFKEEKIEHGKEAVTSDDRPMVALLRKELGGDLSIAPVQQRDKFRRFRNIAAHGQTEPEAPDLVKAIEDVEIFEKFLHSLDIKTVRRKAQEFLHSLHLDLRS
jgi:hypothetical protein